MRRTLITSDPCCFVAHDHVAWSGRGAESLDELATSVFTAAVPQGQQLLFVADDPDPGRLAGLDGHEALLRDGTLRLAATSETYGALLDVEAQRAQFERTLTAALADGYTGICVVADNSGLAGGSDDAFAAWLEWEAVADRMQATLPINGVCFFDTEQVSEARLQDIAALHPVLSADVAPPAYRLFADGDAVRVIGEVDTFSVEQLRRLLRSASPLADGILDITDVDFIDHAALLALNDVAGDGPALSVRGASALVRRMWDLMEVAAPAMELC